MKHQPKPKQSQVKKKKKHQGQFVDKKGKVVNFINDDVTQTLIME